MAQHSFALQAKSIDITIIEKQQKKEEQPPCYLRRLKQVSPISIHCEQNSEELPAEVRNKIFFHYHHFCAVLGCLHAPNDEIAKLVKMKNSLISFFPRLSKGTSKELKTIFENIQSSSFPNKELNNQIFIVKSLVEDEIFKGFSGLDLGIAYLFAPKLNGKRHVGNMDEIIEASMEKTLAIISIGEDFDSPLLIVNTSNDRAVICSSIGIKVNQELIKKHIKTDNLIVNIV